jgi:UDP-glucose:(heptosyl)LPS alpha-1,3-glucosyltransferase
MRLALNFQKVDPTRGGAETYVVDLCCHLVEQGHQVDLYAESWREGVLPTQVRCVAIPVSGRTRLTRMWSFAKNSASALSQSGHDCTVGFINTWQHDVIIPQGGVQRASVRANARRFPTPWQRGLYLLGKIANPKYWVYLAIERRQYDAKRQARVVAVSRMVKEHLEGYYPIPRGRLHVIPNAIHAARLRTGQPSARRCAFRNRLGLEPNDLVGLFVGHNFWLKGLKPLLRALAERMRRDPSARPIHLLVCGRGRVAPFRRMAARLELKDTVHWLGFEPDIRSCFWASDFFVLPTYYDPCSLVVFEALACGLPVITTACNGAGELITDAREGFVITEPEAVGDLAQALDRMAGDECRARMSANAARLGREQSFENHVAKLTKVFAEVAAAKARRGPHASSRSSKKVSRQKGTLSDP